MTWFQILNPPLNSYDLGQVTFTSQLCSRVTGEYYSLPSLVVFRNEATYMKAPEVRKEIKEKMGESTGSSASSISRKFKMEFSTEGLA